MANTLLLNANDAAKILGVKPSTLCMWRYNKRHIIPYVKIGTRAFYRHDDIETFIQDNLHDRRVESSPS